VGNALRSERSVATHVRVLVRGHVPTCTGSISTRCRGMSCAEVSVEEKSPAQGGAVEGRGEDTNGSLNSNS
jgi:hypothetical protein